MAFCCVSCEVTVSSYFALILLCAFN
uniref:Uncharacterized protein n=1 Tax=Arundo donax TaxID=35708 RepID=A0A0A9HJB3_ARUDO